MLFIVIYLVLLFIAPQLWIEPFVGLRVDLFLYPAWLAWVLLAGRGPQLVRLGPQDLFFIGLLAWILVTSVVNPGNSRTWVILIDYAKWLLLYRLVIVSLPTHGHLRAALMLLLVFGLILAFQGIHQMRDPLGAGWAGQGFAWMDELTQRAGIAGRTRWINIFDGPGVYCVVFTMTLPLALHYVWRPFGLMTMAWGALMVGVLLLATWYTGSRGGFIATLGVFGLFALSKLRISVPRMALVAVAIVVALMLAPERLTSTRDSHRSAQHRVDMWAEGVEMIEQNPAFGIGRGNFARYTGKLIAHNSAIEIMGETGFPGLFFWLGFIYMGYKNIICAFRDTPDSKMRSYLTALGLSIAGYLLSSLFVTLEYETLYFLLALAAASSAPLALRPAFNRRDLAILAGMIVTMILSVKTLVFVYARYV